MKSKAFFFLVLMLALLCVCSPSPAEETGAQLQRSGLLDTALSLLEKGNVFLARYNQRTGAQIEARFAQGVPYFYGGKHPQHVFAKWPDYVSRKSWQDSVYYRKGQVYVSGFDCAGFTQWVFTENGLPAHASLRELMKNRYEYGSHYLYTSAPGEEPPPPQALKDHLLPGDLLVIKHGASRHVMMYIGTLRQYGYTADVLPELADYLDYPLVIHCGPHPDFAQRFQQVIEENKPRFGSCVTTDGGVCVSIIGLPYDAAPNAMRFQVTDFYWFELEDGYKLTIQDYQQASSFIWYRHSK